VPIEAAWAGTLDSVDAEAIGTASVALGAGRIRKGDPIDPAVGLVIRCKIGDRLEVGQPVGEVHARSADDAADAARRVLAAFTLTEGDVSPPSLIHRWIESTS